MRTQTKEPFFNSKELNKILPSYLLDEINEQQEEKSQKNESYINDIFKKEPKKETSEILSCSVIFLLFLLKILSKVLFILILLTSS